MNGCVRCWVVSGLIAAAIAIAVSSRGQAEEPSAATHATPAATAQVPVPVPEPSAKALAYYQSGNVWWSVYQVWELALPAVILLTGFSARLRTWAQRIGRKWFFVLALYYAFYVLVTFLVTLPLDYYAGFVRQHSFGLSTQTLGKWFTDSLKGLAIGIVFGGLLLWVPYLLLAKSPRRWWLYTGLLSLPLMILGMLVFPIWIAPLFNDFGPMKDKPLEREILALADRVNIEGGRVFEVNKSVDTKAMNAYVAGLGHTKRIVLWDTLVNKLDHEEVLAVVAHEMGHYVLGHVVQGILLGFLSVLLSLYVVYRLAGWLIERNKGRFGFDHLGDVASLPLVLLLVQVLSLAIMPAVNAYSRHMEREADRFSLELTENNHAAASAFAKLQTENLSNPRPGLFYMLWRGSHPSLASRIEFANTYQPWLDGQPLRYGEYFRPAGK
jgi:Zn-dependent protease with chaperone function